MYFRIPESTRKKSRANVVTGERKKQQVQSRRSLHDGGIQKKGSTEKILSTDRKATHRGGSSPRAQAWRGRTSTRTTCVCARRIGQASTLDDA